MEDSAQPDTASNSDRAHDGFKSGTELADQPVMKTPSSLEMGSSPAEGGQPQAPRKRSRVETVILMSTLCMAVFLAALDITIVSTALPTISDQFHSTSGYAWVGSAFLLAAAVVAPSYGKLSDIWGRKAILLMANAIFFFGSALSGASVNISMLIVGRAIQGAGGGGLLSLVSIVVGDLFSQRERGKYYGVVGMVWAVAFTLGPLIGGAFTERVSWRWCFYVNLPISGTVFIIVALMLKLQTPKTPMIAGLKAIDWAGTFTLAGGTLMFLLGLQFGGTSYPWDSATVICLIVFGIVTIMVFVAVERYYARYPIVPVHLYSNASNLAIITTNLFHGIVFTQGTYFLPLYCQSVLGSSPLMSGVLLLPFAIAMSVTTVSSGIYIKKTGRYLDCIRSGFIILVLGFGLFYDLPEGKTWSKVILYQIIAGLGVGLIFQPPLIALQSNVPAQDNASATASFGLMRNVASAIGVVIGSVAVSNKMNDQQGLLISELGASTASLFSGSSAQANVFRIGDLTDAQQRIIHKAFWSSIRNIWIIAVSFAAAGFLVCLLIRHKKLDKTHVEVKTGLAGEDERRRIAMEQRGRKETSGGQG